MKVAFYAPMKSVDSPTPSGDRTIARLFFAALDRAGFQPSVASQLRTWNHGGDASVTERHHVESQSQAETLISRWREGGERPKLWFTYHCYWKAPDFLGPLVTQALDLPYVIAEAIRAPARAFGPWASGHRAAEHAIRHADLLLALTRRDQPALEAERRPGQRIELFPPFTDLTVPSFKAEPDGGPVRLVTVAMMRADVKLHGYEMLAEVLERMGPRNWTLDIIGDGPGRAEVQARFARFAGRVRFHGQIDDRAALARRLAAAELFVWPAKREAFGMAYLEAQACGCAVVGSRVGGVPEAVRDGATGLLADPDDPEGFANALGRLVDDASLRAAFRSEARQWVGRARSLEGAAGSLRETLSHLLAGQPA